MQDQAVTICYDPSLDTPLCVSGDPDELGWYISPDGVRDPELIISV